MKGIVKPSPKYDAITNNKRVLFFVWKGMF